MTAVAQPPATARRPFQGGGPLARLVAWLSEEPDAIVTGAAQRGGLARIGRAHPMAVDALLAFAVALISVPSAFAVHSGPRFAFEALLALPLVWRRRYPLAVFVTLCAIGFAQWLVVGVGTAADLSILIALYTVATRCPRRVAVLAAAIAELGAFVASWQHNADVLRAVIFLTALVAAAFFLGTNIRTRREYLAALVERAQRLEHERDQQAEIAVAAERARIAREMHDVVAHSLAVMVTMADGAALKGRSDPDRAVAAMHHVSETGRHALGETRRLVNVLRTSPGSGPLAPQPGLAQLEPLLAHVRATGLRGVLTVRGEQFPVPEGAQLAAYRIVQEALTNTLKHACHATRADVSVWYHDGAVELDVTDDGDPQPGAVSDAGGHGLVGMRERAAMYGGSVAAGPRRGRGWSVRARLEIAHALV